MSKKEAERHVLLVVGNVPYNHIMESEAEIRKALGLPDCHIMHATVTQEEACAPWAVVKGLTAGGGSTRPTDEELRIYFYLVAHYRPDQVRAIVMDAVCWEDRNNLIHGRFSEVQVFGRSSGISCTVTRPLGAMERVS